jgi:6-phosphofructokinase 1
VSEGATFDDQQQMSFESEETDQYGHRKLGGIGDRIAARLKDLSRTYNNGRTINVLNQRLGYLVRCGEPDALDSMVPMAFGNLALDLVLAGASGQLVSIHDGRYDTVPISTVTGEKKIVNLDRYYSIERLRPKYESFMHQPLFFMTSDR